MHTPAQNADEAADVPVAPQQLATAQQDVPLAWFAGERKLAGTSITPLLEWHTYPAPSNGGKKG